MKRIFVIAVMAIGLAGCQGGIAKFQQVYGIVTTATVPAETAQIAVSSFEVLEAGSTSYFIYCKQSPNDSICAPGTKAAPGPLRIAIKYIRQGRAARDQVKAAGKTGALISSTVYNLLTSAITNLNTTPVTTFGVPK